MRRHTVQLSLNAVTRVAWKSCRPTPAALPSPLDGYNNDPTSIRRSYRWSSSGSADDTTTTTATNTTTTTNVVDAEEWIRPDRPLVGDKGHSHLMFEDRIKSEQQQGGGGGGHRDPSMVEGEYYQEDDDDQDDDDDDEDLELARIEKELEELERLEKEELAATAAAATATSPDAASSSHPSNVDWLKTRRTIFGDQVVAAKDELKQKQLRGELGLPILKHTLLSSIEVSTILTAMGGTHISVMSNMAAHGRMGVGTDGMIVVTARTSYQIRSMAVALIRQLRLRQLGDCGVLGATMGTKRRSFSNEQSWLIIDCGNYEVHIMSPAARQYYQLERLWGDGADDPVLTLDCTDEEAVDRYLDADYKEQQQKASNQNQPSHNHGFINSIISNNKNSNTSWKEMYAKLQNVPKRKDVVVPITNPPQRRKKNNMNRWR